MKRTTQLDLRQWANLRIKGRWFDTLFAAFWIAAAVHERHNKGTFGYMLVVACIVMASAIATWLLTYWHGKARKRSETRL